MKIQYFHVNGLKIKVYGSFGLSLSIEKTDEDHGSYIKVT